MLEPHRRALLAWFDTHARDLPWRKSRDPYAIWVSEVMLQQTRVETVIPYFERFMTRFPTARALAEATDDDVLSHWSGLGYYRRARLLMAGVRELVATYGGEVPRDPVAIRALPGVGAYTAGAISSVAYDLPEPIVDGNVARVLARVHRITTPLGERTTETALWAHARAWADGERPGTVNQALMELGATLCGKGTPHCEPCPLARLCAARAHGETTTLPRPKARRAPKTMKLAVLVARTGHGTDEATFLERSEKNLFTGLHVPPMLAFDAAPDVAAASLARTHGITGAIEASGELVHVLTHRRLELSLYVVRDAEVASLVLRRVTRDEVATIGVPTLTRKVLVATGFGETPGAARRAPKPTGTDRRARAPRRSRKSPAEDR